MSLSRDCSPQGTGSGWLPHYLPCMNPEFPLRNSEVIVCFSGVNMAGALSVHLYANE